MPRVHLVLFYFERPNMVKVALQSFLDSEYTDWHLTVIDDSENHKLPADLSKILPGYAGRDYEVVSTNDTKQAKISRPGSIFGKFANEAIRAGVGDIIVPVCDDDAIRHDALGALVKFYDDHPDANSAWSKVIEFDPRKGTVPRNKAPKKGGLNRHSGAINAHCQCDSSQVTWRKKCFTDFDPIVGYPYPSTCNLDAHLFACLAKFCGLTQETGFVLQYKGVFPNQLGKRTASADQMYGDPGQTE